MKRLKYIAFTVLLASFSLQSCDLERYPLTDLSEDNFWTDDKNAELALTSLYTLIPQHYYKIFFLST